MIFVVTGRTGNYDSAIEWFARAFETEEAAKSYIEKILNLIKRADLAGDSFALVGCNCYYSGAYMPKILDEILQLDPRFQRLVGHGVDYYVDSVELEKR